MVIRVASALISVSLALEPKARETDLLGNIRGANFYLPCFPTCSYLTQAKKEGLQKGELGYECMGRESNPVPWTCG